MATAVKYSKKQVAAIMERYAREQFRPLEDLRNEINPIRVLHDAVTFSGIADMGPAYPMLTNLEEKERPAVDSAAKSLLRLNG